MDSTSPRRCRFFIVDNSEDLAWSLAEVLVLEPDLESAGYWYTGAGALAKARDAQADILILDFKLPDCTAMTILEEARASAVSFAIVVYSGYMAEDMAAATLANGAAAYVAKGGPVEGLIQEMRRIHEARRALPADPVGSD
jgi:two-component system, NarL family, invasion response regulator UvrY